MARRHKAKNHATESVFSSLRHGSSSAPALCALIVIFIGLTVLGGWLFDIEFLKRVLPGYVFMNPTTAIAFILSGISLQLLQSTNGNVYRTGQVAAGVVAGIGLIKLFAIAGFFDVGIDQILFPGQQFDIVTNAPNRMAPNTALNFLLIGAALVSLRTRTRGTQNRFYAAQYLALAVLLTSFLAIIGFLYGAKTFYIVVSFNPMAIHTAAGFSLLSVGLLLSRPDRGLIKEIFSKNGGGETARRLLPLIIIVPAVLGWLRLQGEQRGFYEREVGTALLVVAIIIILATIVLNNARSMNIAGAKRKRIEEALEASAKREAALIEHAVDVICSVDAEGRFVTVSPASKRVFGYGPNELIGRQFADFIVPDDVAKSNEAAARIIAGEAAIDFENRYLHKDGSEVHVMWSAAWSESDQLMFCVAHDITERKRMADTLLESELRFRSVTQSANDAIIAADSRGNIISWNNGAQQIFGYTEEQALGKPLTILMPEVYREGHRTGMARHDATGESHVIGKTVELKGLRKNGSEFPLDLSLSSWVTEEGRFYSGIIRDITERKKADEALYALASIVESSDDAIISKTLDGIVTS